MNGISNQSKESKLDPESLGLKLPPGLELEFKIGEGSCGPVYKARFQGETVALKAYSSQAIANYQKRHQVNLAVFEMYQNRLFRRVPQLFPYTAKPIRVLGQDRKVSLCFLQEYVEGVTLQELGKRMGRLPQSLLEAGDIITQVSQSADIRGVDQFMQNIMVRENAGDWLPVIHDFKHVPRPQASKRSLLGLLGMGRKSNMQGEFVQQWRDFSARLEKASG